MRHGGVGLFVKDSMFRTFKVSVMDRSAEGILGVLFTHKFSDYKFIVFSCYLPPSPPPMAEPADLKTLFPTLIWCHLVCV